MHGIWTVFSFWQLLLNFTISAQSSDPSNSWHPKWRPLPPPKFPLPNKPHTQWVPPPPPLPPNILLPNKIPDSGLKEDAYNPKKLYELKMLNGQMIELPIMAIADQDKRSKSQVTPGLFVSPSVRGFLRYDPQTMNFTIEWTETHNYTSNLNSKGRGMELSDLCVFNGHLYAADDKTSIIFRLTDKITIPWTIESDGDGLSNKTFKTEWMTVKDEELFVGGYGKEYTTPEGDWLNDNPLWVKKIDRFGRVQHLNWTRQFQSLRRAIGIEFPAYVTHESCQWSDIHKKWFFLPRKVSFDKYDEVLDEFKGSNYLIAADEAFENFDVVQIGSIKYPSHGFSAFQFIPGTNDTIIFALKSEELEGQPLASFYTIFNINGNEMYVDETKIPGDYKLEGLEFVDWNKAF